MQSRPRPPLRVHPSAIHDQIHRSRPRHRGLERTRACGRTKAPRSRRRAKKQTHSAGSSGSCTCRPRGSRRSRAAPERRSRPARPPGGCRAWLRLRVALPESARSYTGYTLDTQKRNSPVNQGQMKFNHANRQSSAGVHNRDAVLDTADVSPRRWQPVSLSRCLSQLARSSTSTAAAAVHASPTSQPLAGAAVAVR